MLSEVTITAVVIFATIFLLLRDRTPVLSSIQIKSLQNPTLYQLHTPKRLKIQKINSLVNYWKEHKNLINIAYQYLPLISLDRKTVLPRKLFNNIIQDIHTKLLIGRSIDSLKAMLNNEISTAAYHLAKKQAILKKRTEYHYIFWHLLGIAKGSINVLNVNAFINRFFKEQNNSFLSFIELPNLDLDLKEGIVTETLRIHDGNNIKQEIREIRSLNANIKSIIKQQWFFKSMQSSRVLEKVFLLIVDNQLGEKLYDALTAAGGGKQCRPDGQGTSKQMSNSSQAKIKTTTVLTPATIEFEDNEYLKGCIYEGLRLFPPTETIFLLIQNQKTKISLKQYQRDSLFYKNPLEFVPDRWKKIGFSLRQKGFMPFGYCGINTACDGIGCGCGAIELSELEYEGVVCLDETDEGSVCSSDTNFIPEQDQTDSEEFQKTLNVRKAKARALEIKSSKSCCDSECPIGELIVKELMVFVIN